MISNHFALDYQVHSVRSHDGKATIREQCERAIMLGLDEIGFTEHKDFDPADPVVHHFDYGRYVEEIAEARAAFTGQLAIRMGVEVDYQKWFEEEIAAYLNAHTFDFVLGSVHYVERRMLMTPDYIEYTGGMVEDAYRLYFQAVRDSVESGLIDIVGHLEYANRRGVPAFGPYNPAPYREQVADLFDRMIAKGVALEINTAGLRQGVGHTYPCETHITLYAERGGHLLSIGSDAHHPDDLAADYTQAASLALSHGLSVVQIWDGRTAKDIALSG